MEVIRYNKAYKDTWDKIVEQSPAASFMFYRDFMEYHQERFKDFSVMLRDNRDVFALMPASVDGHTVYSHQGLSYGGLTLTDKIGLERVVKAFQCLFLFFKEKGYHYLEYKQLPSYYHTYPTNHELYPLYCFGARLKMREMSMVIDLQHRQLVQNRRNRGMKKALKAGLKWGESDDWEGYWIILEEMLKNRYEKDPVHSLEEIVRLKKEFPENIHLYTIDENKKVLAGTVVFINHETVHAQYIASSPKGKQLGALDLLFTVLPEKFSVFRYFSLGVSNTRQGFEINKGLHEWKEAWGALPWPHDIYEIDLRQTFELANIFKKIN